MKSWRCHDEILTPFGWNLQPAASDEIKSAYHLPALAGFHRDAISSTAGGFLPPTADLTEKSHSLSRMAFFLAGAGGFEPATHGFGDRYSTSWAIPLCAVLSATLVIISHPEQNCNSFFKIFLHFFTRLFLCQVLCSHDSSAKRKRPTVLRSGIFLKKSCPFAFQTYEMCNKTRYFSAKKLQIYWNCTRSLL